MLPWVQVLSRCTNPAQEKLTALTSDDFKVMIGINEAGTRCLPPPYSFQEREDPTMSEKPMPNIGVDLQRIHRVITRGLVVSQENCQTFVKSGFPDGTTAEGFWKYCLGLEVIARTHHETEDDLFFPFLRDRLPDADFDRLLAEHRVMDGILDEMKAARETGSLTAMQRALAKLHEMWHPHISVEEAVFSPQVAAKVMTVPETIELAQKASALSQEHAQPAPLAVPFVLYNLEGEDRASFLNVMPEQVTQQLVPIVWKDEWAAMKPFLLD
jgi:hypothetical protein